MLIFYSEEFFLQTAEGKLELEKGVKLITGRPLNIMDLTEVEKAMGRKMRKISNVSILAHKS